MTPSAFVRRSAPPLAGGMRKRAATRTAGSSRVRSIVEFASTASPTSSPAPPAACAGRRWTHGSRQLASAGVAGHAKVVARPIVGGHVATPRPIFSICSSTPSAIPRAAHSRAVAAAFHSSSSRLSHPPPPLFDYAIRGQFDAVLARIRTHPFEATYRHPRQWTALHCCAEYKAPLEVVRAVYGAHPAAAAAKDWKGNAPADVALEEEVKDFLEEKRAEVEAEAATEGGEVSQSVADSSGGSDRATKISSPGTHASSALRCVDALSERVGALNNICRELQREVDLLRDEIKKSGK